jgi:hypothetical protein
VTIPPEARAEAEAALGEFCSHHSSAAIAADLRYAYAIEGTTALLIEQRPSFLKPGEWSSVPIVKFRYSPARGQWSLYWLENNKWRRLSNVPASKEIGKLLKIASDDPSGVFRA